MNVKTVFAVIGIGILSLSRVQADTHSSPGKTARNHSSSANATSKKAPESKTRSKNNRRAAKERDQNLFPTPPVDLPRRDDEQETDVESEESGTATLMGTAAANEDNGGEH